MYKVIQDNGKDTDPVDLATINRWITFGRVRPWTILTDLQNGSNLRADQIPGIKFPGDDEPRPQVGIWKQIESVQENKLGHLTNAWGCICLGFVSMFTSALFFGMLFMVAPFIFFAIARYQADLAEQEGISAASLPKRISVFFICLLLLASLVILYVLVSNPPRLR